MSFQIPDDVSQTEPTGTEAGEELKDALSEAEPEFAAEEKKKPQLAPETMGMVGVLAACGAVLFFMYLRNGPQSANGAEASASPAGSVVSDFLSHGEGHVKSMWQALHNTDKFVDKFRTYSSRPQVPLTGLRTNPFRQTEAHAETPVAHPEPAESESAAHRRREQERADAAKAAESLQLQSVLRGPRNACLINNTLYQQGQQVDGFVVEQITANSVIVRNGPYRFELKLGR